MKMIRRLSDIPDGPVAIYGTGQAGTTFFKVLSQFKPGAPVDCFINSHQSGSKEGRPVYRLEEFLAQTSARTLVLVVSCQWREIETSLKENQVDNYLIIPHRFSFYSPEVRLSMDKSRASL